jgi:hypothetical protein
MGQLLKPSVEPDVARARQQLVAIARNYALRQLPIVLPFLLLGQLFGLLSLTSWPKSIIFSLPCVLMAGTLVWFAGRLWWRTWQRSSPTVLRELDRRYPELEDSTWLLSQPRDELNFLGQLQQQRVAQRLLQLLETQRPLLPINLKDSWILTATFLTISAFGWWLHTSPVVRPAGVHIHFSLPPTTHDTGPIPARITETQLRVTPPAYTHQAVFAPVQASFQCPQGARVRWQVRVNRTHGPAPELELGRQRRRLQPLPGSAGTFFIEQPLLASTLYRLRYAGTVSDDYAIDVRADQAPVLRISTPKPYTLVAAIGQRPEVLIRATVRDDYGLSRTELVITVAQGQGEAVKFREVRRDLSAALAGDKPQASLASLLNLPKLGLTYGDELYFYLSARDNNGHSTRTDSYLVQWQDTAVADSPSDMGMGVRVAPAYFRSQRQLIIDTEKLIAEKPRLDAATIASRANALGLDQQTLRLRYGKFLGEEMEAGMGVTEQHSPIAEDEEASAEHPAPTAEDHDEHDHAAPARPSPIAETDALMEPYMHRHDDAETADFLEPAVKAKLRAVLDQMWAAELRLRTAQLKAALPYEYRALRLLKQVQQQTRAFVKKAGFTPPPMPEATLRLTGELAGATVPHRQQMRPTPANQPTVRAALRWLAASENGLPTRPADAALLDQAGAALAGAALEHPYAYLPALRALRQLVADARAGRPACPACRPPVQRALTDMLASPAPSPLSPPAPDRLARRYFQELNH